MKVFAPFQNFMSLSLTPFRSIPQKSNLGFEETYPYAYLGKLELMRIKDILTKTVFFAVRQSFRVQVRHIMT